MHNEIHDRSKTLRTRGFIRVAEAVALVGAIPVSLCGMLIGISTALLHGCSDSSANEPVGSDVAKLGLAIPKPGMDGPNNAEAYIVDPHQGGIGDAVFIEELYWGRLVDVYDEHPVSGQSNLVYPDFVIGDGVQTEFGTWRLEVNPLTDRTRLVIERENTAASDDEFDLLVALAEESVGPVLPKGISPSEQPPFSFVARNAVLVVRFSDLVNPDTVSLNDSFQVSVGTPPQDAYEARLLFDPNHGGAASTGNFMSTRLIVDFTVDIQELASLEEPLELNGLGLPATVDPLQPNVAIAIPTVVDPGGANFDLMLNLKGKPFSSVDNGPVNLSSPTKDVVRSMRSGYEQDPQNGFLTDELPPSIIGSQSITISNASADPNGQPGFDFVVSYAYETSSCAIPPAVGDVVQVAGVTLDVLQPGVVSQGVVSGLRVSLPAALEPLGSAQDLLGQALFRTTWRSDLSIDLAPCFVRFTPEPVSAPAAGVAPSAQMVVEFSEAMDPASVRPFDTLVLSTKAAPKVSEYVVANILPSADLRNFRHAPLVGFNHTQNSPSAESLFVSLRSDPDDAAGVTDLAGNYLSAELPQFQFNLDASAPTQKGGGWALPFNTQDEYAPATGAQGKDLAGQFTYLDSSAEIIPRKVSRFSAVADRNNLLIGNMAPVTGGEQTPLSNLGSKLHAMWRYSDVGLTVSNSNAALVNLDVESVSLSPLGGSVTQTFYPQFEMRLGHSDRLPDETLDLPPNPPLPSYPTSGFFDSTSYAENFLADPANPPKIVHPREKGFFVAQTGVFQSTTGTAMLRFPMNTAAVPGEEILYTWRDTSITMTGGLDQQGSGTVVPEVPHPIEVTLALGGTKDDQYVGGDNFGFPSVALPLLMEFRCYPSEAISLNAFDASLALTTSARPYFRAFSTGGYNAQGNPVIKNPDAETTPSGGFSGPSGTLPLGATTSGVDPTVYLGQLDLVVRISRVYTTMIGAGVTAPDYVGYVLEPRAQEQPTGTQVQVAFRGNPNKPAAGYFDALLLDVYGNLITDAVAGNPPSLNPAEWSSDLNSIDGLEYAQVRLTFVSNTQTLLSPRLSALAMAFRVN